MPYRLGADPARHGQTDCYGVMRTVMTHYGITTPTPKREWYRRLRRGDTSVFEEELGRWGVRTADLNFGVVALCQADEGYGLATWYEDGWLNYAGSEVRWSPIDALRVVACFCPQKRNCVQPLG